MGKEEEKKIEEEGKEKEKEIKINDGIVRRYSNWNKRKMVATLNGGKRSSER